MKQFKIYYRRSILKCAVFALALLISTTASFASVQTGGTPTQKAGTTQGRGEADKEASSPAEKEGTDKGTWSVKATKGTPRFFTVKAKDAKLGDITNELSRILKVPVKLSPVMGRQRVTLDFGGMNLEATVRMLSPHPYIDYEIGGEGLFQPKPLAIYLQAMNERPPSLSEVVKGSSEAILIEGDTEEGVGDEETLKKKDEANPLKVSYSKNQLSVRARKQPLTVVLFKIASEVGIPFELRYDTPEIIDVDFSNYSLEQAVRSLSPSVRFFYRTDLQTYDIQPLRLALLAPASTKSED
ncbi:MAG: hypothetical protein LC754_04120 [Acidobacteria bacterium]|nr:hypothetical protein [Acidobacteriota bacterium]